MQLRNLPCLNMSKPFPFVRFLSEFSVFVFLSGLRGITSDTDYIRKCPKWRLTCVSMVIFIDTHTQTLRIILNIY